MLRARSLIRDCRQQCSLHLKWGDERKGLCPCKERFRPGDRHQATAKTICGCSRERKQSTPGVALEGSSACRAEIQPRTHQPHELLGRRLVGTRRSGSSWAVPGVSRGWLKPISTCSALSLYSQRGHESTPRAQKAMKATGRRERGGSRAPEGGALQLQSNTTRYPLRNPSKTTRCPSCCQAACKGTERQPLQVACSNRKSVGAPALGTTQPRQHAAAPGPAPCRTAGPWRVTQAPSDAIPQRAAARWPSQVAARCRLRGDETGAQLFQRFLPAPAGADVEKPSSASSTARAGGGRGRGRGWGGRVVPQDAGPGQSCRMR